MRKFIVVLAAVGGLLLQPATAQNAQRPDIGRIKNVTAGGVDVQRRGNTQRAQSGYPLKEGDIVVTGPGQRVGITFVDNTRISIAPRSRVIISTYLFDRSRREGNANIRIERGAMGVDSGSLARSGNLRFETPNSTLGVRGTSFVIEVDE